MSASSTSSPRPSPSAPPPRRGTTVALDRRTARPERTGVLGWILPPLLLLATGLAVWIVLANPAGLFVFAVGGLVVLALLWVLLSALFPASADRTCPACGRDTLVRLSEDTTEGLQCKACHWRDAEQSSFFLAEEETTLEPLLLARRRKLLGSEEVRIRPWTGPTGATRRAGPAGPAGLEPGDPAEDAR